MPILLWHLGLHRFHLEAGGVEDAFVIATPKLIEFLFWNFDLIDSRTECEGFAIPRCGTGWSEDRPVHTRETLLEKLRS